MTSVSSKMDMNPIRERSFEGSKAFSLEKRDGDGREIFRENFENFPGRCTDRRENDEDRREIERERERNETLEIGGMRTKDQLEACTSTSFNRK